MKKVLLHACCGPCAVWPLKVLREEGFKTEGLFYNPNIHPYKEYKRRKKTYLQFSKLQDFKTEVLDEYMQNEWEEYDENDKSRCNMCYRLRLEKAVEFARDKGYDAFTSTLFVSPYQQHDLMKETCIELQDEYGIEFLYRDFRTGFRKGQRMAKDMGLYRQKYCGCIHSYNQSEFKHKITWDED